MSRFILGDCVRVMATFPDNSVDFMSGSSCTLLCNCPLRTVRAGFPAYGSSLSITPHLNRPGNPGD
ncbi:hypothetical protein J0840_004925 [Escherichia coli]|nr:hypothetical protein [Escherichia coli]EFB2278645.1 hypothetical protein [Escherichia coli]EFE1260182.1 hypothetical protein [Escherichia coli]EFO4094837.1 hypothetical protein [Escherichia coli]EFO4444158.1 hypothetical protein [Escherichia coli]